MTKTQRIINRIQEKESFYDVAYVCEDFETFEIEVAEWGVDHIAGVDFDDPELDREQLDAFFYCRINRVRLHGLFRHYHR